MMAKQVVDLIPVKITKLDKGKYKQHYSRKERGNDNTSTTY